MNEEIKYKGEFLDVRSIDNYEYYHENKCKNGESVSILIFRKDDVTPILASYELVPCHDNQGKHLIYSVTGMIDEDKDEYEQAILEVKEETGFLIQKENLVYLGVIYPTKAGDNLVHMFGVDVTNCERIEKTTDGKKLSENWGEHINYVDWISINQAIFSAEPLLATMIARLNLLTENTINKNKEEN